MDFKIKIENFEGPIDALLQLIEKRKMTINDINLADIADDYIRFIQNLDYESISDTTHFIFVASTLTLIKSKSLLPNLELSDEEEGDIEDLKRRIEIFKIYQTASLDIKSSYYSKPFFYYPKAAKKPISFTPDPHMDTQMLMNALSDVINEVPKIESTKKEATMRIAIHIEEMMDSLEERIKKTIEKGFNFSNFINERLEGKTEPKTIRVYKVVGFLAMLELVKNGAMQVLQKENFDTINISSLDSAPAEL